MLLRHPPIGFELLMLVLEVKFGLMARTEELWSVSVVAVEGVNYASTVTVLVKILMRIERNDPRQ